DKGVGSGAIRHQERRSDVSRDLYIIRTFDGSRLTSLLQMREVQQYSLRQNVHPESRLASDATGGERNAADATDAHPPSRRRRFPQYRGTSLSTFSLHASIPPVTLYRRVKPSPRKRSATCALRWPVWQRKAISVSFGSAS